MIIDLKYKAYRAPVALLFLLFCLSKPAFSQEQKRVINIFEEEKITLLGGIGFDYGWFGFRCKYKLHKNIKAVANFGVTPDHPVWNVGFEANTAPILSDRILPYFTAIYGANASVTLTTYRGIQESRIIESPAFGIGFHYQMFKAINWYISAGINYRIITPESERFEEEFNSTYGENRNIIYEKLFPSLGMTLKVWK